tara:strand:- start:842 stop:1177 length:336 start_codon:yes stop_codon:yes gene_type:complete
MDNQLLTFINNNCQNLAQIYTTEKQNQKESGILLITKIFNKESNIFEVKVGYLKESQASPELMVEVNKKKEERKKEDDISKYIYFYVHYEDNGQIIEMNLGELNNSIKTIN